MTELDNSTLTRGRVNTLTVTDLQPGSTVVATIQSTPELLGRAPVDDTGQATLNLAVAADFPAGDHTLTLTSYNRDGQLVARAYAVEVDDPTSWLITWSPYIAIPAAVIALVGLTATALITRRGTR